MNQTKTRYLILNADDYGMSQSTNEAVEDLFDNGFVTSTTLMTPCPWAEDAVARAKKNPRMRVGLHTTLNSEWAGYRWGPVSREGVGSLVDGAGYFPHSVRELLAKADPAQVATELGAQMHFMCSRGLPPTHVDNHMGSVYGLEGPGFMEAVFALCAKDRLAFRMPRSLADFGLAAPSLEAQMGGLVAAADSLGIGLLDRLLHFGRKPGPQENYDSVLRRYIEVATKGCVPGVNEMYMHPALETAELKAICGAWQMRVWEHRVLRDPAFRDAIGEAGIVLAGWKDVPFTTT